MKNIISTAALAACLTLGNTAFAEGEKANEDILIGHVLKSLSNPFFVKMKEGADKTAAEQGVKLINFVGNFDGDNPSQVTAVETLIAAGADGILIAPSDTAGITPALARAREAGMAIISFDTLEPRDAADAVFSTDNRLAGKLIGQYAAAKLGDDAANARIALLDLIEAHPTVDIQRNQGFLEGFGVDVKDPNIIGDEDDPRIVGSDITLCAEEGGRTAMESLLQRDPGINVVYAICEPAAAGAIEALKAFGLIDKVIVVSIDGGCPGIQNIIDGLLTATATQSPDTMTSLAVEAIVKYVKTGEKPKPTPGLPFFDTGTNLVTNDPIDGVASVAAEEAIKTCWG